MSARIALVTDGSAAASALAEWLGARAPISEWIESLGPVAARDTAQLRLRAKPAARVVLLAEGQCAQALSAERALRAVRRWTAELAPIAVRADGPAIIEQHVREGAEESRALIELASALGPGPNPPQPSSKRGRPAGAKPFHGAGFEVCVLLLLEPARRWKERELAEEAGRAPSVVHRVLGELRRRGYVLTEGGGRGSTGTRPQDPELLRDDLAAAWRERVGSPRASSLLVAKEPGRAMEQLFATMTSQGAQCLLAGESALPRALRPVGAQPTVYLDRDLSSLTLPAGMQVVTGLRGDLQVWSAPEPAALRWSALVEGVPATNRVVTFLDLMTSTSSRVRAVARELWEQPDGRA